MRNPLVELLRGVREYLLLAQRARRFLDEEIQAREQPLELVARLADGLAHFLRQRMGKGIGTRDDELAEFRDRGKSFANRRRRPARLRRAGGCVVLGDLARAVCGDPQDDAARRRIGDYQRG